MASTSNAHTYRLYFFNDQLCFSKLVCRNVQRGSIVPRFLSTLQFVWLFEFLRLPSKLLRFTTHSEEGELRSIAVFYLALQSKWLFESLHFTALAMKGNCEVYQGFYRPANFLNECI